MVAKGFYIFFGDFLIYSAPAFPSPMGRQNINSSTTFSDIENRTRTIKNVIPSCTHGHGFFHRGGEQFFLCVHG